LDEVINYGELVMNSREYAEVRSYH
jgi:hypothetical protein